MELLKFISYNSYLLEGLKNQTLYFNNIYNFNDPFEGIFRYKVSSDYNAFKKFFLGPFWGSRKDMDRTFNNKIEFEALINKRFVNAQHVKGVCCFSAESKVNDIIMWSNYANRHKGICLIFDSDNLFVCKYKGKGPFILPSGPREVKYTDKYLDEDPLLKELNSKTFLTTKFQQWSNEKEYRYISSAAGNYNFNPEKLIEIVFGLRILPEAKETIKKIVNKFYKTEIKYSKIIMEKRKFALTKVEET